MKKIILSFTLSLLIIVSTCISAFASTVDFGVPEMDPPYYDSYIIYEGYYQGGITKFYMLTVYNSADWDVYVDKENDTLVWIKKRETAYVRYSSRCQPENYNKDNDLNGWFTLEQDNEMVVNMENNKIHKATEDIYDEDNLLFFRGIPLEKVIQKTLTEKTIPTMVGIMKVLTLCGVGCLALLIVLKLFGKRCLIFRH